MTPINNQVSTEWGHGPINNQLLTEWCYGSMNNQVSTELDHNTILLILDY
jgi:hypothetical protein